MTTDTPPTRKPHPSQNGRLRNRQTVLRSLLDHRTLTRADIPRITGLSKSACADLVAGLIEDGLVAEGRKVRSAGRGKPAVTLSLRPDAREMIVIDIAQISRLRGAVFNLGITQGETETIDVTSSNGISSAEQLTDAVDTLVARLKTHLTAPLLGIGIASPGIVSDSGEVLYAPNLGLDRYPLARNLSQRLGTTVYVDNNTNVAALGESALGDTSRNIMLIQIARGVGAGLVIDGSIVHGTRFNAGEIAHIVVDENGEMCRCGKRGCLETVVSIPSIARRIKADPSSRERTITEAGVALGKVLAMPAAMTGIDSIVIDGDSRYIDDTFLAAVDLAVNSVISSEASGTVTIRRPTVHGDLSLGGEAVAVTRRCLS